MHAGGSTATTCLYFLLLELGVTFMVACGTCTIVSAITDVNKLDLNVLVHDLEHLSLNAPNDLQSARASSLLLDNL